MLLFTLHGTDGVGRLPVGADGEFGVEPGRAEHPGGQDRGDACQANGFFVFDHFPQEALDLFVDFAGRAVGGEGGEVFYSTVTAGKDEGIELLGTDIGHVADVASGDAGGFFQDAAVVRIRFSGGVIGGFRLSNIGGHAGNSGFALVESDQDADRLGDFAAVKNAASTEDHPHAR